MGIEAASQNAGQISPEQLQAQNAYRPPERVSMELKLAKALAWLGENYVCAQPARRIKR